MGMGTGTEGGKDTNWPQLPE